MAPTVHVATVHWQDDRWVDVQLRHLERNTDSTVRVYAFLNDLPRDHSDKFFYSSTEKIGRLSVKLNLLSDIISFAAEPDDFIVFLDGDAFPIAPLDAFLGECLSRHELVAVKRVENGETRPHPCFCAMRVGFWRELGGRWRSRHQRTSEGESAAPGNWITTPGQRELDWHPLLRSNRRNPHPLFFGIYGDLVYHHGAGFRPSAGGKVPVQNAVGEAADSNALARLIDAMPRSRAKRALRRRFHPAARVRRELEEQVRRQSVEIFERIEVDPRFYCDLLSGEEPRPSPHSPLPDPAG